ncbi:MAG TPA: hypothetical protein VM221_01605 [Armatimonadota bacterium]|nr:hypothetical protein [Armatimonadota bacterium]
MWVELIGFDNRADDLGAAAYLDTLGFIPDAIALFVFSPDFVLTHSGLATEKDLPPDCCSYGGHPFNAERDRQVWSTHQVRRLTDELHRRGVAVFLSTMTFFLNNAFHQEWVSDHRELLETRRTGDSGPNINALKRLRDGTYYEELFVPQLVAVMRDYGFDGWHAADGNGPLFLPLNEADYSDDMLGQFAASTGIALPAPIAGPCDGNPARMMERADWIWAHRRRRWITFYADRWAGFHAKVASALHDCGKRLMVNSAWTRDPFEALYRYGMDYRKLAAAGVDGFVVETVAGAISLEAGGPNRHYDYLAMLMLIGACVPDSKLIVLHSVGDTNEQWDLLRHAPAVLEREICMLANTYHCGADGRPARCATGLMVCLGDGLRREEWTRLRETWEVAFAGVPRGLPGASVVWSDAVLHNQLDDFIATGRWPTHRILFHLMAEGAPVQSTVNVRDVDQVTGPLVVINPGLFPEDELRSIFSRAHAAIILVGGATGSLPPPDVRFEDVHPPHQLVCWAYGVGEAPTVSIEDAPEAEARAGAGDAREPLTFTQDLPGRMVSPAFLRACVRMICEAAGAPALRGDRESVRVLAMETAGRALRVLVESDRASYARAEVDMGQPIEAVRLATRFPVTRIVPDGARFTVKVPPKGIVALDVTLAR